MTDTAVDDGAHLKSLEGYHYRIDDHYEVGREKVREYARAVQDRNPAHHDDQAAADLGFGGVIGSLTFVSIPAMVANRRIFETVLTSTTCTCRPSRSSRCASRWLQATG